MRTIRIQATPATEQVTVAWLAHLALDIPTGPDGGAIIFDGNLNTGTVVAQRQPGRWTVSFRPNPDGTRLCAYTDPHVVARVILAGEHDEAAAIRTGLTDSSIDVTTDLLTGADTKPELAPHELAVWAFLVALAARLEDGPYPASLVAALPSYHQLRDAVDPDQRHFKGQHVTGLGDALRAVSAYDRSHGRPTVTALVRRAGGHKPGPGRWDDGVATEPERMAAWHRAVREAVAYWHANTP
jgi:hypothetical protein